MAKLIWWLGVMIACLMNSVEPFHMEEIGFIIDHYYTSTLGQDDPATIYQQFFSTDRVLQPCNPTPNDLDRYGTHTKGNNIVQATTMFPYLLALSETEATGFATYNIPEGTLKPLVAPFPLKLVTSPTDSNYSTYMLLQGLGEFGDYTFEIYSMECWYCCIGHTKFNGANYQHFNVDKDSFTDTIKTGQCLGLANSKTQVVIKLKGKEISFDEFYDTTGITTNLDATRPGVEETSESTSA